VQHLASESKPLLHESLLVLIEDFLTWTRENGSQEERDLYASLTILGLIQRLIANVSGGDKIIIRILFFYKSEQFLMVFVSVKMVILAF